MPPPSRRPGYIRPSRGGRQGISRITVLAAVDTGSGDHDLKTAANLIRAAARGLAAGWSANTARSIYIRMNGNTAEIVANYPAARPAELRLMHPLFGDRAHWYGPPGSPFLAPAVDATADKALTEFGMKKIDRWARAAGFG